MKFINSSVTYFLTAIFCIVAATGCLDSNNSQISSTVQFGFQVDHMDSTLTSSNNDSIHIDRVRLVYGNGSLGLNDTSAAIYEDSNNWQQYEVPDPQSGANPILLFPNIRFPSGTYNNLVFSVRKAPEGNSNIDPDFTGDKRYTLIIDGSYNGDDFTFKSEREFQVPIPITPSVNVPQYDAQYVFLVKSDTQNWFAKSGGGFYDPRIDENSSAINDSIEQSFTIETQSNMRP